MLADDTGMEFAGESYKRQRIDRERIYYGAYSRKHENLECNAGNRRLAHRIFLKRGIRIRKKSDFALRNKQQSIVCPRNSKPFY